MLKFIAFLVFQQGIFMKKRFIALISLSAVCAFASPNYKESNDYKSAYKCAIEGLKEGSSPVSFCVGNSRDPSKVEEKAYKDAEQDFLKSVKSNKISCEFGYAVWMANGSRSDNWEEGPQKAKTLREAINLMPREMKFFDKDGKQIPNEIASRWFVKKGDEFRISDEAKKSCSKSQLG